MHRKTLTILYYNSSSSKFKHIKLALSQKQTQLQPNKHLKKQNMKNLTSSKAALKTALELSISLTLYNLRYLNLTEYRHKTKHKT